MKTLTLRSILIVIALLGITISASGQEPSLALVPAKSPDAKEDPA